MIKKVFLSSAIFLLAFHLLQAQVTDIKKLKFEDFKPVRHSSKIFYTFNNITRDSIGNESRFTGSKKSPGLAFLYSLFVPGTGQLYAKRFDVGKYYMISEAALWLGFASFTIYGNWLLTDAHKYAQTHAGIDANGKDNNFFVNIANYDNVYQFNDDQLRNGRYDQLYDPLNGYYFYWDNVNSRKQYRLDQLAGDRVITDRLFFVGAIIVNHIISAVSAIVLTNAYNDQFIGSKGSFMMNADVLRYGNRINGIQLKLTKWF